LRSGNSPFEPLLIVPSFLSKRSAIRSRPGGQEKSYRLFFHRWPMNDHNHRDFLFGFVRITPATIIQVLSSIEQATPS
jgi:hypothetical protein